LKPTGTPVGFTLTDIEIAPALDAENYPLIPSRTFPAASTAKLYCWFAYTRATPGVSKVKVEWYIGADKLSETELFAKQTEGNGAFDIAMQDGTFPVGSYSVKLYLNDVFFQQVDFTLE
jgi:hypothetical protein